MLDFLINVILFFLPLIFLLIPNLIPEEKMPHKVSEIFAAILYGIFVLIFNDFFPEKAPILVMMPVCCVILYFLCFYNKRGKSK